MPVEIKKQSAQLPNLNRPQHPSTPPEQPNTDRYQEQNMGAMNSAIALQAQETTNSLQQLHQRLEAFEERFADAAVDRIDSVALRIEQKIAAKLNARIEARKQPQIVDILDAFTVPEFGLPPAINPATSAGGALPAAY